MTMNIFKIDALYEKRINIALIHCHILSIMYLIIYIRLKVFYCLSAIYSSLLTDFIYISQSKPCSQGKGYLSCILQQDSEFWVINAFKLNTSFGLCYFFFIQPSLINLL